MVLSGATPEETLELTRRMRDSELVDSFKGRFDQNGHKRRYKLCSWATIHRLFNTFLATSEVGTSLTVRCCSLHCWLSVSPLLSMLLVWLLQRIAAARVQDARAD